MRKVRLAFGILTGMLATSSALADIQILTGSSGIGNQDTHFTYTEPNSSNPLIPVGIPSHSAWVKPILGGWIGPPNGNRTAKQGKYVYVWNFELSNVEGVALSGKTLSDNRSVVWLNDNMITENISESFVNEHFFSASSAQFKVGENELRFEVTNYRPSPSGLYVNANITTSESTCQLYAVHDDKRNDSQLLTISPETFEVKALGNLKKAYDLEALDIYPQTAELFAASGEDTNNPGFLYTVDKTTGELTEIGATGFNEIDGLSFAPDGTLWGWASGDGLVTIDTQSGQATLVAEYPGEVEDLTWSTDGSILYGVGNLVDTPDVGMKLLAYDTTTDSLNTLCEEQTFGQEIEALDTLPDDTLVFGFHGKRNLSLGALNPETCKIIASQQIYTYYNDIEGIAWQNCH
jgi:hypothetical protein